MKLFGLGRQKDAAPARFPDGRVGYAVGDIHGRADLLSRMLDCLEADWARALRPVDAPAPIVVFLGDYIDRGPASADVIALLESGRPAGFERRFLKGNHEAAMLAFMADGAANRAWLSHGGLETMASYDVRPLPSLGSSVEDLTKASAALALRLPPAHRRFLEQLERYVVLGDYCFVHAGVDPARRLDAQADADLFWIRQRFLGDARRLEHVVVHGHTPATTPHRDHRRIGLDTGAYFTGVLSAVRLEGDAVSFLAVR